MLWTVKYAPQKISDICGNKGNVEKLSKWLELWCASGHLLYLVNPDTCPHRPKSLKSDFKKPGSDGVGGFRCILISGPPGVGKTTAAHLVANLLGYNVLELNASDTRSKKLLDVWLSALALGVLALTLFSFRRPPSSRPSRTPPSRASSRLKIRCAFPHECISCL